MASTVLLKASGLQTSPNELQREEGSLIEANNIIIKRDNIIEQRRGFKVYGNSLPDLSQRVKQLTTYRNRLIRHYANVLQYDFDGLGAFRSFTGNFLETEAGLRMKFIESNGNFYFTTSNGIKKISARNSNDFTNNDVITSAGAIKAVDFTVDVNYVENSQSSFLPQDSAVSYRVLWGYKDLNNNLVLGAPSQRVVASNPMLPFLIRDYTQLLTTLDNLDNTPLTTARINDKNYVETLSLSLNASANDLYTNLISLSQKIDNDIFLADQAAAAPLQISTASVASNIVTINFSSGTVSDYIQSGSRLFLAGVWTGAGSEDLSGEITVTSVTPTSLTFNKTAADGAIVLSSVSINSYEFRSITEPSIPVLPTPNSQLVELQSYYETILTVLSEQLDTIINAADKNTLNQLDVTTTATVNLDITIPVGIDSRYFFQVYRSNVSQATGAATFDDVVPSDELQLVYEAYPTQSELNVGQVSFTDITPDDFRGANLYTNASTGEGILQANDIPPFAKDINRYKSSTFYANTRTQHRLFLNLLGVINMISDYDNGDIPKVTITDGNITNTYNFIVGKQQITEIETIADSSNSLNGTYFFIYSLKKKYYVYFETTTAVDPAIADHTGIKVKIPTNATAIQVAQKLRDSLTVLLDEFLIELNTDTLTITTFETGITEDAVDFDTGFSISTLQNGNTERVQPEITKIETVAGSLLTAAGVADYFTLNVPFDQNKYYFYFDNGIVTDPALSGFIGIKLEFDGTETDNDIAQLILDNLPSQFTGEVSGNILTITANQYGEVTPPIESVSDVGFTITVEQEGALDVLISPVISPAQAVDQTARSFIRIINKNPGDSVYGYYLSSAFDVPGKFLLESRTLENEEPFYVLGNNDNTGTSFNPDIGPEGTITNISVASNTVITTSIPHGLITGDSVVMSNTNSVPRIDGLYPINYISPTSFSIDRIVTSSGNEGVFIRASASVFSENEARANRVYYSKTSQPDAVPIANFFDIGAGDMKILRIFPLRDSLFVFKEDGLYRISGESAPFQLELFDNSFILLAPDSVSVSNNILYAWTTQGIQGLSEGGSTIISRPIDNIILRIQSANFTNFKTATWGVGYESDNSYLVFTVNNTEDTFATICYRYSTLTNTWTTYNKSNLAGVVNMFDDKLYLSASDIPNLEQERKTFSRLDFADREFTSLIANDKILGKNIILPSVIGYSVGDVFVQDQTITTYQFNALLEKLDFDPTPADQNYFSSLELKRGENPRAKLNALAQKLDNDVNIVGTNYQSSINDKFGVISNISENNPTIITSNNHGLITGRVILIDSSDSVPSINGTHIVTVIDNNTFSIPVNVLITGTVGNWQTVNSNFQDLKTCYNKIIELLNVDNGIAFTNYRPIDNNTIQEAIITNINTITKTITLNLELDYLVGDVTIFKAIKSSFTYSPTTMGDPLMYKHLREATIMFENRNITSGSVSFATDLLPQFQKVEFKLEGNGIFGHVENFGDGFFGGMASSAPFRTYVPRQCMRCRYMIIKFEHNVAREDYKITGMSLTGEIGQSTRAYR